MHVETATMDEVDRIVDLWVDLAVDQRQHGSHVLPEENRVRIRESIVRHVVGETVLIARESDEVVGFVTFAVEEGSYRQSVSRGLVENLYVVPQRRGRGIGSRLLAAAEEALADRGVEAVTLQTMARNDRARSFYRDHGYDHHRVTFEKRVRSDTHTRGDR